jgi:hypothetical protein
MLKKRRILAKMRFFLHYVLCFIETIYIIAGLLLITPTCIHEWANVTARIDNALNFILNFIINFDNSVCFLSYKSDFPDFPKLFQLNLTILPSIYIYKKSYIKQFFTSKKSFIEI